MYSNKIVGQHLCDRLELKERLRAPNKTIYRLKDSYIIQTEAYSIAAMDTNKYSKE
jgi:hypothetical protein